MKYEFVLAPTTQRESLMKNLRAWDWGEDICVSLSILGYCLKERVEENFKRRGTGMIVITTVSCKDPDKISISDYFKIITCRYYY